MSHVSSRSGVATLRTAIHLLLYLLTYSAGSLGWPFPVLTSRFGCVSSSSSSSQRRASGRRRRLAAAMVWWDVHPHRARHPTLYRPTLPTTHLYPPRPTPPLHPLHLDWLHAGLLRPDLFHLDPLHLDWLRAGLPRRHLGRGELLTVVG